ncbi:MAG: hypothetical protein A2498_01990 [Lentisphaerae bacterium RIFOXYC12_FULL_60_16]|nr:MAG: hypothetical protein A2498_01990 [Lentisphaerae bacterium RIFOXYC12_FULL_60_16]
MLHISNPLLTLAITPNGTTLTLEDRRRNVVWTLDPQTSGYKTEPLGDWQTDPEFTPFGPGTVDQPAPDTLRINTPVPGGAIERTFRLLPDGVEAQTVIRSAAVLRVAHPGHFIPDHSRLELLIPINQGLILRNFGDAFLRRDAKTMLAMSGCLTERGGLLITQETPKDCWFIWQKRDVGIRAFHEVIPGAVEGWYPRVARIYVTDPSITAIAKRHRLRLIERGHFMAWPEKIARKPILKKLFGSLIAFIGYNRGRSTDYVASARRLKSAGFDSVLYYPVRFMATDLNFLMGGDQPIDLSQAEINALQACGGLVSPWAWTYETRDTGTDACRHTFRTDAQNAFISHWQIDENIWYKTCTPYQSEFARSQFAGPMSAMDWVHYDVNSVRGGEACFNAAHALHNRAPLSARDDDPFVGELLGPEVNGNRIVSSEGFNEYLTRFYDIGSNKYLPTWGAKQPFLVVPLTDLVFHDSTLHNSWELHTYNAIPCFGKLTTDSRLQMGAGLPEKKAALDALYGVPPLVFPFGRQYGWADIATCKTFSFEISLDDAEVQRALTAALPIARLHHRIGQLELIAFEALRDDYTVQATTFADGTRVVANISESPQEVPDHGLLPPNSWKVDSAS